jgi:hypothetical protein
MIRRTLTLTATLAALAACGGSNEAAVSDSAATVGPSVDSASNAATDSGYVNAQRQLDSLKAAGVSPAEGIDSAASRAGSTLTNDPTADTMVYRKMRTPPKANP